MINRVAVLIFKLTLYPWIYLRRRKVSEAKELKSLLLVNTTGIGDTILSTPAWQSLKKRFPDAHISLMVHEKRRDVVVNNPFVDNIITYRKFFYFFKIVRELQRLHIDVAVIFHGNDPDILPLIFLGGVKEIIGYKKRTRLPYLLTKAIDELPDHFIQAQMKLAGLVGGDGKEEHQTFTPVFFLGEEERKKAGLFLEKKNLNGKFLVGILPGAGRPYKCWPAERFTALARYLLQKDAIVFIFGSKKEVSLARKVERFSGDSLQKEKEANVINVAGSHNLREASALMERLDLFITNDSGPLHIAIALNVPTVALFCPSDPGGLLWPGKDRTLKIIKKDPPCSPCITKRCRHPFCMEQISVEEVIDASEDLCPR